MCCSPYEATELIIFQSHTSWWGIWAANTVRERELVWLMTSEPQDVCNRFIKHQWEGRWCSHSIDLLLSLWPLTPQVVDCLWVCVCNGVSHVCVCVSLITLCVHVIMIQIRLFGFGCSLTLIWKHVCVFAEQNSGDCLGRRVCSASPSMDTIYVLITGIHPAGVHTRTHTHTSWWWGCCRINEL